MHRIMLITFIFTLSFAGLLALPTAHAEDNPTQDYDLSTVQSTIDALYNSISGDAGEPRDWDAFRNLFAQDAHLRTTFQNAEGNLELRTMTVEQFAEGATLAFEGFGFYESEISSTAESFGNVVHVFSTYQSKNSPDDAKPFARGINSIQLYTDGTRWHIVSIIWDSERENMPIPAHYLKN